MVDALVAAVLTATTAWEALLQPTWTRAAPLVAAQVAGAAALGWRRHAAVPVAALVATVFVAASLATDVPENLSFVVVCFVAAYSAVAYAPSWRTGAVLTGLFLAAGAFNGAVYYGNDAVSAVVSALIIGGPCAVGAVVRRQRELATSSERRAAAAEDAREAHARAAVATERARIARELHDVVAHAISVVVLQARGGRRMLDVDPAESRAAFDSVEQVAGQALAEMRRLLALLRATDGEPADFGAQPSLRRLDDLVAETTAAGLSVAVEIEGDLAVVPAGVDVTAYRIEQEALTNVRKHARATTVRLAVTVDDATLALEVVDDGVATGPAGPSGFGILGMRERAALFGGELTAGVRPEGGFRVGARLPLSPVPA